VENPHVENPRVGNHAQLNTKESITYESITNGYSLSNGKARKSTFIPPTVQEVADYIDEKGYHIDPETFVDFYESKGWVIGKDKMKDWKAAVRTWEKRHKQEHGGKTSSNPFLDMLNEGSW
jgi:hypothetical protein